LAVFAKATVMKYHSALCRRIAPTRLSFFCIKAELPPAFVFGFAAWSKAEIKEGLTKLAMTFEDLKAKAR